MTGPKRRIVDFRSLKGYAEEHLPEKLHFPSVVLELGEKTSPNISAVALAF